MVIAVILLAILFIVGFINTLFSVPTTKKISAWLRSKSFRKPNSELSTTEVPKTQSRTTGREEELKKVFATFDKNGDGYVTSRELKESLKMIGICMTEKETGELIEKLDENGDGLIDLHEFCNLFETMIKGDEKEKDVFGVEGVAGEEELKEAFCVFDGNKDGLITVEELFSVLASLGLKEGKNMDDCKDMIRKVDVDGDGMVSFLEFKTMMKSGLRLQ